MGYRNFYDVGSARNMLSKCDMMKIEKANTHKYMKTLSRKKEKFVPIAFLVYMPQPLW